MAYGPVTAEATMGTVPTYFGEVRASVRRQHAEIRARLRGLDAGATPGSSAVSALNLRVSLFRLAVLFESHLRFEELELAPLIRELDAWGAAREAAMLAEHREQRTRLEYVCFVAESEPPFDMELGREVSRLVVALLDDMAREERELEELERLGCDDILEQMTG